MLAIGNNELGEKLGEVYKCTKCGGEHKITYGTKTLADGTTAETRVLSFYKCGDKTYLAGIQGRSLK